MTSMFGNPFFGRGYGYGYPQRRQAYYDDEDDYERYAYAQEMARRRQEQQMRAEEEARRQYYEEMRREEMRRAELLRRQRMAEDAREHELRRYQAQLQAQRRAEAAQRKAGPRSEAARRQLRVWTIAATIIQRAFRAHLARRREALKIDSAQRIAAWYKSQSELRTARRALSALSQLGRVLNEYHELNKTMAEAAFSAPPRPDGRPATALLAFEDALLRLFLKLDGISTGGIDGVRLQRKELADLFNRRLDTIEQAKHRPAPVEEPVKEAEETEDNADMDKEDEKVYSDFRSLKNYVAVPIGDAMDSEEGIRAIFSSEDLSLSEDESDNMQE